MTKILECGDIFPECGFRAMGETDDEVLQRAAAHAKNEHDIEINAEFVEKARTAISEQ